ncbi:MAG: YdiU family protein [Leptospiraceae bacterium]|nr:YdiU family protein [Leptospiraceae bacterium]MDW8306634.1 YdiU family protein [Leptospiraceae bacterium]
MALALEKKRPYLSREAGWNFDNSYLNLSEVFYRHVRPTIYPVPQMVIFNSALAEELGLRVEFFTSESAELFTGNELPEGAQPIAQAYAGHQFGVFTMLGDGRAILLGEQITPEGRRFDIQFKGSGLTPFSRRGDGRAALGPMLREYIMSECLHALGIPTTRSLCVAATGEGVWRERLLPGAVLTRVAASHIRVGTFEYAALLFAHTGDIKPLEELALYSIRRHYPEILEEESPYELFLKRVMEAQISLIVKWLSVGFIHGVMNTDNMAISGETIDFGPCAFMEEYHPLTCFSSIDYEGRYAYSRQGPIGFWNLCRFAESLLPLFSLDPQKAQAQASKVLEDYDRLFEKEYLQVFGQKLGIEKAQEEDLGLIKEFLAILEEEKHDFTNAFRALGEAYQKESSFFSASSRFKHFQKKWKKRLKRENPSVVERLLQEKNPAVIARNLKVEEAIAKAEQGDLSYLHRLLDVVRKPYEENSENEEFRRPAGIPYRTFCGT